MRNDVPLAKVPVRDHNSVYYRRIVKKTEDCRRILDVGCGDGLLAEALARPGREIVGIDPSEECIRRARERRLPGTVSFFACSFEAYGTFQKDGADGGPFDAVIFVASLHHMEMERALIKAKSLLRRGGLLLIVGLASPSGIADYAADCFRMIPAWIGTRMRGMKTAEELGIPASYRVPEMAEVRKAARRLLPGAAIRYGLYWRYLLTWTKNGRS